MGDKISNLTPRVVVNQSTAPTGSDNELKNIIWIDSSSGDTAKTYNTSTDTWESIGGKPDNLSIIKNANDNLAVDKPSSKIIGDFESTTGDWAVTKNVNISTDSGYSVTGSQSLNGNSNTTGYAEAGVYVAVDVSDYDTVTVNMRFDSGWQINYDQTGCLIKSDSTFSYPDQSDVEDRVYYRSSDQGNWVEGVLNCSDLSGTYYIHVVGRIDDGVSNANLWVDGVSIDKSPIESVGSEAGN